MPARVFKYVIFTLYALQHHGPHLLIMILIKSNGKESNKFGEEDTDDMLNEAKGMYWAVLQPSSGSTGLSVCLKVDVLILCIMFMWLVC